VDSVEDYSAEGFEVMDCLVVFGLVEGSRGWGTEGYSEEDSQVVVCCLPVVVLELVPVELD
jgi:hypothetical protein